MQEFVIIKGWSKVNLDSYPNEIGILNPEETDLTEISQ
jgi:hypothetical protein